MLTLFGHDQTTTNTELDKVGKQLFGVKYLGTFPGDRLPEEMYNKPTNKSCEAEFRAIINVDTAGMQGSHWVAVAGLPNSSKILVFDSFGRASRTLLPHLKQKNVIDTDNDREQKKIQLSCGQFSMSWLLFAERYGWKNAQLI